MEQNRPESVGRDTDTHNVPLLLRKSVIRTVVRSRINKKGQGKFHLARYSNRLRIDAPLPKNNKYISLIEDIVKSRKRKSSLLCFHAFHQHAPGGTRTRILSLAGKCLIQLDDRGVLSFDNEANNFDNLSKNGYLVKGECHVHKNFSS